jgi:formate hydrogenlyase transcriptional activator
VRHFAKNYADRMQKPITAVSEEFMAGLIQHSWPGNVRELQNLIERSVILSASAVLNGSPPEPPRIPKLPEATTLEEAERSHILETLKQTEGVVGGRDGAAARLGLPRTTLIAKMRRLRISAHQNTLTPARTIAAVA